VAGFESAGSLPRESAANPLLALLAPPRAGNIAADTCDRCGVLWVSHGRVALRGGIGPPGARAIAGQQQQGGVLEPEVAVVRRAVLQGPCVTIGGPGGA
jgi:hypothetical protein